jgi:hypothetical protein
MRLVLVLALLVTLTGCSVLFPTAQTPQIAPPAPIVAPQVIMPPAPTVEPQPAPVEPGKTAENPALTPEVQGQIPQVEYSQSTTYFAPWYYGATVNTVTVTIWQGTGIITAIRP